MSKLDVKSALEHARQRAAAMDHHELLTAYGVWSVRTAGPTDDRDAATYFEVLCVYRVELLRRLLR